MSFIMFQLNIWFHFQFIWKIRYSFRCISNYTCIDGHLCLLPIINIWHNKKYSILFYSNYFLWYFNIFLFMLVRETFLFPSVRRCVPYLCRHCHLFNGNVYLWFIMIFLRTMSQYIGNVYRLSPCISRSETNIIVTLMIVFMIYVQS